MRIWFRLYVVSYFKQEKLPSQYEQLHNHSHHITITITIIIIIITIKSPSSYMNLGGKKKLKHLPSLQILLQLLNFAVFLDQLKTSHFFFSFVQQPLLKSSMETSLIKSLRCIHEHCQNQCLLFFSTI